MIFRTPGTRKVAWGLAGVLTLGAVLWFTGSRVLPRPAPGPPLAVALQAFRSQAAGTVAPQGRALSLETNVLAAELPAQLRAEIVTDTGRPVDRPAVLNKDGRIVIPVPAGLSRGAYWVRLLDGGPNGEILREYSLPVE
jgi:hypothetical protein